MYLIALSLLIAVTRATEPWAIILSGTRDFWNYRHQASACRAYQLFKSLGFNKEDQIIQLNYDDVARNELNPFRGELFSGNGNEVYKGCKI